MSLKVSDLKVSEFRLPDLTVRDLGGFLRDQRQHARLSLRQLAAAAGVSNPYLSQVERGLRRPSAEVLQQIARGLRISAEALYVRAGILQGGDTAGAETAIWVDPHLTDRQKRTLTDIYASFRAENARSGPSATGSDPDDTDPDDTVPGSSAPDSSARTPVPTPVGARRRGATTRRASRVTRVTSGDAPGPEGTPRRQATPRPEGKAATPGPEATDPPSSAGVMQ